MAGLAQSTVAGYSADYVQPGVTVASETIVFPPAPSDGQGIIYAPIHSVSSVQTSSATGHGQTGSAPASVPFGQIIKYVFSAALRSWLRTQ